MILKSKLNTQSLKFKENFKAMEERVRELKSRFQQVKSEGLKNRQDKWAVRKRIEALKDPETEFLELSPLAADGMYEDICPGAGLVTGIARISGKECVVIANNYCTKGGAYFPLTVKKHLRAQEVALENRLPCIYLVDSAGAYLPLQSEIFPDRDHFGRIFYNQAQLTAQGLSQIAVVLGSCTAGGAYVPAMSDENIIVKGKGTVFLGGPPLVKAATGEVIDSEILGGGEVHCHTSGVCDHLADSEKQAMEKTRQIVARLPQLETPKPPQKENVPPLYPEKELYGIVSSDLKNPFSMKEVLARLLDRSEFEEFKEHYGTSLITGWGHICGQLVGVLASENILFSESALKGTHFIDLCDKRGIPLIFLQNIMGFMVGKKYEWEGIAKHGAKMVTAVSLARVPKFTVILGGSFGAGNYGLCGRAYQGRFLWMWPSAKVSVMGGDLAAEVLWSLKKNKKSADDNTKENIRKQYEQESSPYYSTARLWDDGLIDPLDTRKFLALGLSLCREPPKLIPEKGIYRM